MRMWAIAQMVKRKAMAWFRGWVALGEGARPGMQGRYYKRA